MAWRSSGNDNDDMVNNLTRFGVISSTAVEEAFRSVDRIHFVPQTHVHLAHSDQPLKEDNVHISAPHIYGTIVESLDLEPGSSQNFLNIGSGTGYLSCIVSQVLGPDACLYGVEIYSDVIEHCQISLKRWKEARQATADKCIEPFMEFVCGNGLEIEETKGECQFGFDRVYVGASVSRSHLVKIANLLRPGGVLVAPVEDDLIKVARLTRSKTASSNSDPTPFQVGSRSPRSINGQSLSLSEDFSIHVVSGVRFAPLLRHPSVKTVIPSMVWDPSVHQSYPKRFKSSIKEILLCSHAPIAQPPKVQVEQTINVASKLPKDVWMKVLSYTHRSWFDQPYTMDTSLLLERLRQEQQGSQRAKEACAEAERRMRLAERERDGYKLLAMRWQLRLRAVLSEANKTNEANNPGRNNTSDSRDEDPLLLLDDLTQAAASLFSGDNLFPRIARVGQRLPYDSEDNTDADDDDNEHDDMDNNETEEMNVEAESDDDEDNNHEMDDTSSDEDDSEDLTIAASPDTLDGSFYHQVSQSLENQAFFT